MQQILKNKLILGDCVMDFDIVFNGATKRTQDLIQERLGMSGIAPSDEENDDREGINCWMFEDDEILEKTEASLTPDEKVIWEDSEVGILETILSGPERYCNPGTEQEVHEDICTSLRVVSIKGIPT